MNQLDQQQLRTHVNILGWILIAQTVILLLGALFILLFLPAIGSVSGDREALTVLSTVGISVSSFMGLLVIPGFVVGIALLQARPRPWVRYVAFAIYVLGMLNIPLGTCIGVYAAWVLLQNACNEYFAPYKPA